MRPLCTATQRSIHTTSHRSYQHLQPYTTLANTAAPHAQTLTPAQQQYNQKIVDLYRRTLHALPKVLDSYHIQYDKRKLRNAAFNIRQQYVDTHRQKAQSTDIVYDTRMIELLLHRAEINLYDMLHGYKTRAQIKQLLAGSHSEPATLTQQLTSAVNQTTQQLQKLVGDVTQTATNATQQATVAM